MYNLKITKMRKLLFVFCALASFVNIQAKSDIFTIKLGDPLILLQENKKAIFEIDYSQMIVTDSKHHEKDLPFREWMITKDEENDKWTRDWEEEDSASCDQAFRESFNHEIKKGIRLSKIGKDYKVTMRITMIDFGPAVRYIPPFGWSGGIAQASGELEVMDLNTGEAVLLIDFKDLKGEDSIKQIGRLKGIFENLGEKLNDFLKDYVRSAKKKK